jgi:hypothetical protein
MRCTGRWLLLWGLCVGALALTGCDDGEAEADGDGGVAAGGAGGGAGDGGEDLPGEGDAGVTVQPDAEPPENVFRREHVVNIVDSEAAAAVRGFMTGNPQADFAAAARIFFAYYPDEYDFLYLFSDGQLDMAPAGIFTHVRYEATPGTGLDRDFANEMFGSEAALRGVVALNFFDGGNGPTLHETLHYWAVHLDRQQFGFGRDAMNDFGAHWGVTGVMGQLGGYDPSTLRCKATDTVPPCEPDADGTFEITLGPFDAASNGGDGIPYAPLELYLMGLLPAAEVPEPIPVLQDANFLGFDQASQALSFRISGIRDIPMAEIIGAHGERVPLAEDERAFRGAFVIFSDEPVSEEAMERAENWAAVFGGDADSFVLSFEDATGGRATMDTRLGSLRD